MEYPIIDTLTTAYIRNGWTGLELTTGKNLFTGIISDIRGLVYRDNVFTNTQTDTKAYFQLQVQTKLNNAFIYSSPYVQIESNGVHSLTFTSSNFDTIRIKHNGSVRDLFFETPLNGTGYYTLSINVSSHDPTIIGGVIFNDVQIERGSTATPYEPYHAITDIFSRTRLPLIRYFPHPVIDSLQRASDGTMTADDVQVLRHYLTKFGIGNIELGRFHAINPNISDDIREIDLEPIPIDEPIKEKKTGEEDLNVKTE